MEVAPENKNGDWAPEHVFVAVSLIATAVAGSGWSVNLIVFLVAELNVGSITATLINYFISGCLNLFSIVAVVVAARSFFDPLSVVRIFSFISLLGILMLTLISTIKSLKPTPCAAGSHSCESPSNYQYGVLYLAIALASLGCVGAKSAIIYMGRVQLLHKPMDPSKVFQGYLIFILVDIYMGYSISFMVDKISWGSGFGTCFVFNAIGLAVFLWGKGFYHQSKLRGGPFATIARLIITAVHNIRISSSGNDQGQDTAKVQVNTPTKSFRFLNAMFIKTDQSENSSDEKQWGLITAEDVEELETLIEIVPLWSTEVFLCTIMIIHGSLTMLQVLTMDRHLIADLEVPRGSFGFFTTAIGFFSICFIDPSITRIWQKITGKFLTFLQLQGISHVCIIIVMVVSALIESRRLHVVRTYRLANKPGSVVPMSSLWLLIPLSISGFGQSFCIGGQIQIYHQEFPRSKQITPSAMGTLSAGIGCFLSIMITSWMLLQTGWLPNNINDGRLDNVFWMLAGIGVVNFGWYLICAKRYKLKNAGEHDDETSELASLA